MDNMVRTVIFLSLFGITALSVAGIRLSSTKSSFTSTANNQANSFGSAPDFATQTPIPAQGPTPTPSSTPTASPSPSPTPFVPQAGDVVINEIMWGGNNDEWIELRNMTSHDIDVSGWIIDNAASSNTPITLPAAQTILANSYYLVAKDKTASGVNITPDFQSSSLRLTDTGEVLTLHTNLNQVIDTANTVPNWLAGNNGSPRHSMERKDPPGDGTIVSSWQDASTHTNMDGNTASDEFGTPKAANGL